MIRMLIAGSRADGELMAKRFGVNHIWFEPPGPFEGEIGVVVVGVCDDEYHDQVAQWYNSDDVKPGERFPPGSIKNLSGKRTVIIPR